MSRGCHTRLGLSLQAQDKAALCYGSISLFTTILHNVFILYHIELFVNVFKIDKTSFWIGESLFLIWNSVNDPLFGWIGDKASVSSSTRSNQPKFNAHNAESGTVHQSTVNLGLYHRRNNTDDAISSATDQDLSVRNDTMRTPPSGASAKLIMRRTRMISTCGPLLAVSFVLLWFDWMVPSIQFALCLCLYDAFLTVVDLHHSALLADLSITTKVRTSMNMYESIFSAIGSSSVFLSYIFWDKHNLTKFRIFCVVLASFSALGFYVMSRLLQSHYLHRTEMPSLKTSMSDPDLLQRSSQNPRNPESFEPHNTSALSEHKSMRVFIKQLLRQKNFLMFAIINVIQVFHCHFNSNFFPLFIEALVEDHQHYGAFLIGVSFVLPHLNNIVFLQLSRSYGVYTIIRLLFYIKLLLAVVMWTAGMRHGWMLCLFIASNRVFTEGTCKLLSLVISDLIDEDYVRNNRDEPISALMFGMANFLAKPGQTLAPIVGTSLISAMTGRDVFSQSAPGTSVNSIQPTNPTQSLMYRQACFSILVYVPIVCASVQIVTWSFYKLHGTKLKQISSLRANIPSFLTV